MGIQWGGHWEIVGLMTSENGIHRYSHHRLIWENDDLEIMVYYILRETKYQKR